jgi:hypothetical protein
MLDECLRLFAAVDISGMQFLGYWPIISKNQCHFEMRAADCQFLSFLQVDHSVQPVDRPASVLVLRNIWTTSAWLTSKPSPSFLLPRRSLLRGHSCPNEPIELTCSTGLPRTTALLGENLNARHFRVAVHRDAIEIAGNLRISFLELPLSRRSDTTPKIRIAMSMQSTPKPECRTGISKVIPLLPARD